VSRASDDGTALVVGLGDLGASVLDALARRPGLRRLVGAGRDAERGRGLAGQARLVAGLSGGPAHVDFERLDLREDPAAVIARVDPDVIVMAASEHTWWRAPRLEPALAYGAWLPLQVPLVRRLMEARRDAGVRAPVVALPFPDAVGPALAADGLAPEVGAGNVAEVAAKLAAVTGAGEVRLVMHHASERVAFGAFATLRGHEPAGEAPWRASVRSGGEELPAERVSAAFHEPYALASGRATHGLTAAATVSVVEGLLSEHPVSAHVPAPGGRPGGYPVRLSRAGVELDLPAGLSEADAVALNAEAARWDGIEQIDGDGTVVLTEDAAAGAREALGVDLARMAPGDLDGLAAELRAALLREPARAS
jgi:hypothetical protein